MDRNFDSEESNTPTVDRAEAFLRSMYATSDDVTTPEISRSIFFCNVYKDPFYGNNIKLSVLKFLGYPIEYRDEAKNGGGTELPECFSIWVDSEDTSKKLLSLIDKLSYYDVPYLILFVENGRTEFLYKLLSGQGFPDLIDDGIKHRKLNAPQMERVKQRCFMTACERIIERGKPFEFGTSISPQEADLYTRLIEKGKRGIDPEALGLLMIPCIQEILARNPELSPQKAEE